MDGVYARNAGAISCLLSINSNAAIGNFGLKILIHELIAAFYSFRGLKISLLMIKS